MDGPSVPSPTPTDDTRDQEGAGDGAAQPDTASLDGNRDDPDLTGAAERASAERPSIGLALGGGGARGWAHIGVLHVLAEHGIRPDVIAGTSVGAIAGGAFSAGKLTDLERFARSITARSLFSLVDLTPLSSGLVGGRRLEARLSKHLAGLTIEGLPIRTVFIASELATGHEIWLRRGNLIEAMRASYALPGVFKPVTVNGRALVDGALVNPVPVSVCRAYGARLVIAVNLTPETMSHGGVVPDLPDFEPGFEPDFEPGDAPDARLTLADERDDEDDPPSGWRSVTGLANPLRAILKRQFGGSDPTGSVPGVMMQSFTIIQDRLTRMRLAGDPPDASIAPHVAGVGLFDFHKADEAIEAGREAATGALDTIAVMTDRLSRR